MTRVKALMAFSEGGEVYEQGEVLNLPPGVAEELEDKGVVNILGPSGPAKETTPQREQEGGISVETLLPKSTFLGADDVEEGDVAVIVGTGHIDDSFEQERLVLPVIYKSQELRVSLGSENIERISRVLGMNTKTWVDREIKVAMVKHYRGLGQKGIVWTAVEEE